MSITKEVKKFLTPRQVSRRLTFHVDVIRQYCQEGRFPKAKKISGRWLIPEESLEIFLEKYDCPATH